MQNQELQYFADVWFTTVSTTAPMPRTTYIICYDPGTWYQIMNKYSGNEMQTVCSRDSRDGSNGR